MLVALNKPYGVLCRFTPEPGSRWATLAGLGLPPRIYPVGRLDADSEGLLLLSDEDALVERMLHPSRGHEREYWAQVERIPAASALESLRRGVVLPDLKTLPCRVRLLDPAPRLPDRLPPIRSRKTVPDCWLSLVLHEGKNRQVRRMTAAVGHPTLRLWRERIGDLSLTDLALPPGDWRVLDAELSRRAVTPRPA